MLMYCFTFEESSVWLYHANLRNYCGHARCNYCTVLLNVWFPLIITSKHADFLVLPLLKDLIFECKPHLNTVMSIKWDIFTKRSWRCSKRKYSRTSVRVLFSFNFIQARWNIFFNVSDNTTGYGGDELAFREHH